MGKIELELHWINSLLLWFQFYLTAAYCIIHQGLNFGSKCRTCRLHGEQGIANSLAHKWKPLYFFGSRLK